MGGILKFFWVVLGASWVVLGVFGVIFLGRNFDFLKISHQILPQPPPAKYGGRHTVTLIPGDGIGPELMLHVKDVFRPCLPVNKLIFSPKHHLTVYKLIFPPNLS
uniref:Uncharacterized protein n=1 Tax=Zosterops lateralis melanops TaxID=1220523 RepID=A0A8D2NR57_ZOSLA